MSKLKEVKEYQTTCDCGCKSQVFIQKHPEHFLQIDTRDSGRHKWHGVVLYSEKMEKVKKLIK